MTKKILHQKMRSASPQNLSLIVTTVAGYPHSRNSVFATELPVKEATAGTEKIWTRKALAKW